MLAVFTYCGQQPCNEREQSVFACGQFFSIPAISFLYSVRGWLGGVMVLGSVLDSRSKGCEFDSRPGNTSGQVLHTHVPLLPSSINWYWQKLGNKQATM